MGSLAGGYESYDSEIFGTRTRINYDTESVRSSALSDKTLQEAHLGLTRTRDRAKIVEENRKPCNERCIHNVTHNRRIHNM